MTHPGQGAGGGDAPPAPDALEEALDLISRGEVAGVLLRLVGGLAVQHLAHDWVAGRRTQRDIDLVARRDDRSRILQLFEEAGYRPDRRFNALHGRKQLYFVSERTGRPVDVILGALEMCHTLDFAGRLELARPTLPLADLILSKLQIVRINQKDLVDLLGLLHEYPLTHADGSGINVDRIVEVTSDDWGWWRTVTGNLDKASDILEHDTPLGLQALGPGTREQIAQRLAGLRSAVDDAPKSLRWRLRATVGERVRWYEEPDEEEHD
jgi:hypothetical protein